MLDRLTKLREERANSDKGFTLIELLVVVVIIGILIAIAIPLYLNYTKGASDKSAQSDVRGAISAIEQCNTDNGGYPSTYTAVGSPVTSYTASAAVTNPCTNPLPVSKGTTLNYSFASATNSYIIYGSNSSGNGASKNFCYNSGKGGGVQPVGTATTC